MSLRPKDREEAIERARAWDRRRRAAARRYEDKVKGEVLDGEREWSSVPPVNADRRKKLHERNYGTDKAPWIREQVCYVSGRTRDIVAAHTKRSRGAGGDKTDLVPFNIEVEMDWHALDEAKFAAKWGVTKQACKDAADEYEETWQRIQAGEEHGEF